MSGLSVLPALRVCALLSSSRYPHHHVSRLLPAFCSLSCVIAFRLCLRRICFTPLTLPLPYLFFLSHISNITSLPSRTSPKLPNERALPSSGRQAVQAIISPALVKRVDELGRCFPRVPQEGRSSSPVIERRFLRRESSPRVSLWKVVLPTWLRDLRRVSRRPNELESSSLSTRVERKRVGGRGLRGLGATFSFSRFPKASLSFEIRGRGGRGEGGTERA